MRPRLSKRFRPAGIRAVMRLMPAVAALALFFSMPALAAQDHHEGKGELIRKEKSLEDVRRKIKREKQAVRKIQQKEASLLTELERINIAIAGKKETLRRASEAFENAQTKFVAAGAEISRLENEKKAINVRLKLRLRSIYMMRGYETVNVFMPLPIESGDALGPARVYRYMTAVTDSDKTLIDRYEKTIAQQTAERQRQLEFKENLAEARKEVLAKKEEAEASQAEKKALLDSVKQKKRRSVEAVKELEGAAAGLADLVKTLREGRRLDSQDAKGFAAMKGRLPRPVQGNLVSGFGKVRHPKFGTVTFNNGIFIGTPEGRAVKNIYNGTVVHTGWLKGYGNIIIIDHGDGYYSLFAYLLKIMKEKGDAVAKGDVVGIVGSTGLESAPGLYFEIRERGVTRDPSAWLAAG